MTGVSKKQCSGCKEIKLLERFHEDMSRPDGLHPYCKQCRRNPSNRWAKGMEGNTQGIDDWCQVDSVLREMSEMQHAVDIEQAACERQIAIIKKESQQRIEPCQIHQSHLRAMLEDFIKKSSTKTKTIERAFRFGSVRLSQDKVSVGLNVLLAAKRMGKS